MLTPAQGRVNRQPAYPSSLHPSYVMLLCGTCPCQERRRQRLPPTTPTRQAVAVRIIFPDDSRRGEALEPPSTRTGNGRRMSAGRTNSEALSQHWCTPPKYVDAVKEFFGGSIALDPCSNRHSIVSAQVEYSLPETDGLAASWDYPTVFVNPPYGRDRERCTSCAMVYWGPRHERFERTFIRHGAVVSLEHLNGRSIGSDAHAKSAENGERQRHLFVVGGRADHRPGQPSG